MLDIISFLNEDSSSFYIQENLMYEYWIHKLHIMRSHRDKERDLI